MVQLLHAVEPGAAKKPDGQVWQTDALDALATVLNVAKGQGTGAGVAQGQ